MLARSSECDQSGPSTPKKIKKHHYKQNSRYEWLVDSDFKEWLKRDPKDSHRAICVLWNASMLADKGAIKRHEEGNNHLSRTKATSQTSEPNIFHTKPAKNLEENNMKVAEIKLATFIAGTKFHTKQWITS